MFGLAMRKSVLLSFPLLVVATAVFQHEAVFYPSFVLQSLSPMFYSDIMV